MRPRQRGSFQRTGRRTVAAAATAGTGPPGQRPVTVNGTRGYGLTTFRSPTIERFGVQVVGKLPGGGLTGIDLILARVESPALTALGGVPAGASGSPIYVDGRLVGALAATFGNDPSLVAITPIATMLALGQTPDPAAPSSWPGINGHLQAVAGGFQSAQALRALAKGLRSRGLTTPAVETTDAGEQTVLGYPYCPEPAATASPGSGPFQPGGPIGTAALLGDLQFGFIGTITKVSGRDVWGFGHPGFFLGPIETALTAASIVTTAEGPHPFKVGILGPATGTVRWDGAAGIVGTLGTVPATIPLTFAVTDLDRDYTVRLNCRSVRDSGLLRFFTNIGTVECFAQAMDRAGGGTVNWRWQVETPALPQPLVIAGSGYSAFDAAGLATDAIQEPLHDLLTAGIMPSRIALAATVTIGQDTD